MTSLQDFLDDWHTKYPHDILWRRKYNVPLFSEQHLSTNPIDAKLDLMEDQKIAQLQEKWAKDRKEREELEEDMAIEGSFLKRRVNGIRMEKVEIDDVFDKIDLDFADKFFERNTDYK